MMKRLVIVSAMILSSTLLALIAGELILRQFVNYPQPQFLQLDRVVGHRNRANVEGYFTREGMGYVKINSHGFRDAEYPMEKTAKKRIVVLGDSYAEAMQIDLKDTYHEILETEFKAQLEVLNFGVSGFGTCQELLMYQHYARQFNPDIVVLAFYPENDFTDNVKQLAHDYARPYCSFGYSGLELDNSFRKSSKHMRSEVIYRLYYFLTDHLIIFSLLDKLRYIQSLQVAEPTGLAAAQRDAQSSLLYAPSSTEHLDAWLLTEQLILKLAAEVNKDGAEFVLFVQDSLPGQLSTRDNALYVEERFGKLCRTEEMLCGFVAPAAIAVTQSTGKSLHGFAQGHAGHWNRAGHRIAYNVLRNTLTEYGLVSIE